MGLCSCRPAAAQPSNPATRTMPMGHAVASHMPRGAGRCRCHPASTAWFPVPALPNTSPNPQP
eukprot:77274-Chlamydomonas_euryale.AAC.9